MDNCDLEFEEVDLNDIPTHVPASRIAWREEVLPGTHREVPEEEAIAITYNGSSHAVMMATPDDLEDFAIGFSLTERIIVDPEDVHSLEIVAFPTGVEARLWIDDRRARRLSERRRSLAGPTGCGLCGVDSLEEALPKITAVNNADARFTPRQIVRAINDLSDGQPLFGETHAVHAAGFWTPQEGNVAVREDLGRHNAMDKLVGALCRQHRDVGPGIATITSRVSVEIVQKAAILGVSVLVAVSAPTSLAIETAREAGMTLIGVARHDGFETFTHPERVDFMAV